MRFSWEQIMKSLCVVVFLWLAGSSAWADMSVASLNGSYHFSGRGSNFWEFTGGGEVAVFDYIYAGSGTIVFDGNGTCSVTFGELGFEVGFSSPDAVTEWPESGTVPCSYSVSPVGLVQVDFGDSVETFRAGHNAMTLIGGGGKSEQQSDGVRHLANLLVAVKAGTELNTGSLNGTYRAVSLDASFSQSAPGSNVTQGLYGNNVTLTFDGAGNCVADVTGQDFEVNHGSPNVVQASPDSGTITGNYSVSATGVVTVDWEDEEGPQTWWLSGDGSVLVSASSAVRQDEEDDSTDYSTGQMVAVKTGSDFSNASLDTTFHVVSQGANFKAQGEDVADDIEAMADTIITFDGAGSCITTATEHDFEVLFATPNDVQAESFSGQASCTYDVSGNGLVTLFFAGDEPETFWLSTDGNMLLGGGALIVSEGELTGYDTSLLVAVNSGTIISPPNPLNDTTEFVKQLYRDFLNREGDEGGIQFWVDRIDGQTSTRAAVVESFLLSPEFGERIAPVVRLYFAYFLRIPDYDGLMFWVGRYAAGTTLEEISNAFAGSPEFQQTYGSLSNEQFVQLVYQNVLGREPDDEGLAFWTSELDGGNRSRGQVMAGFSESAEFRQLKNNQVYVTMTYVGLLRRAPDQGGFDFWVGRMDAGNSGQELIDGFLNSAEYASRFIYPSLFLLAPQSFLIRIANGTLYQAGSSFSLEIQNTSDLSFTCTRIELHNGVEIEGFTEDPAVILTLLGGDQIVAPDEIVGVTFTLGRDVPVGNFQLRYYLTRPDTNERFIVFYQFNAE